MTKELHKAITNRSRLQSKFLKTKIDKIVSNGIMSNVQWNYCKKVFRSTNKSFFNNSDMRKNYNNNRFKKKTLKVKRLT